MSNGNNNGHHETQRGTAQPGLALAESARRRVTRHGNGRDSSPTPHP